MATNLNSNYVNKLANGFLEAWNSKRVFSNIATRSKITDMDIREPASGTEAYIRRPYDFRAIETADGDLTSETLNSLIRGRAKATAQNVITIPVEWYMLEEALEMNADDIPQIMAKAARRAVTKFETNLADYYMKQLGHTLGTVNTAITKWSDISQIQAFAESFGFPDDDIAIALNPWHIKNLADAQKGHPTNTGLGTTAWEKAQISGSLAGINNIFSCSTLSGLTNGVGYDDATIVVDGVAPTQTYVSAKDTYQTTIALTGFAENDTLVAGQRLQISDVSWVNQDTKQLSVGEDGSPLPYQCVVITGDTADSNGDMSVVVQGPAIYEATGQYNTLSAAIGTNNSVTVISGGAGTTNVPSIWAHKEAIGVAFTELPELRGWESRTVTADDGGFSMRMTLFSDGITTKQYLRIDLQPWFGCYNPLLGGTVWGKA
jgi:hypothetical protein